MKKNISVAVIGLVLAGISVAAEQSFVPPPAGLKFSEPWRPDDGGCPICADGEPAGLKFSEPWRPAGAKGDTRIVGTVIDIRQVPVTYVKVQLRDLDSGALVGETETNANGEYAFEVLNPGNFVVEMVLVDGYVIALSNAGALARYETLQTVIQLPGRWDAVRRIMIRNQITLGFVGVSSETSMTGATLARALDQSISPVDAGEPVSPLR